MQILDYMNKSEIVKFDNVSISIPLRKGSSRKLIENISFSLSEGSTMALLGPNGSGKSTIINTILGDYHFSSGLIKIVVEKNDIGFIPQNYRQALFPWLSVATNIELYSNRKTTFSEAKFHESLRELSLSNIWDVNVSKLSGGEQQLLLLCLITSLKSRIFLLDEPLSAVDLSRRNIARDILNNRLKEIKASLILVSHDVNDAVLLTGNSIILSGSYKEPIKYVKKDKSDCYLEEVREALYA